MAGIVNSTAMAFVGYSALYVIIYRKNRLFGNIGFMLVSLGVIAYATDDMSTAIGITLLLLFLGNLVFDLLTPPRRK